MIFQSPSYPGTYDLNLNCTYLFKARKDHRIELAFSSFDLEGASPQCSNDYIVVRDGPNEKSTLINKFCGTKEPAPIISSTNLLYVFFVSNDKFTFQGFNGTYRVISEGRSRVLLSCKPVACIHRVSCVKGAFWLDLYWKKRMSRE